MDRFLFTDLLPKETREYLLQLQCSKITVVTILLPSTWGTLEQTPYFKVEYEPILSDKRAIDRIREGFGTRLWFDLIPPDTRNLLAQYALTEIESLYGNVHSQRYKDAFKLLTVVNFIRDNHRPL